MEQKNTFTDDPYFKNLDNDTILKLAKKSFQLVEEFKKMELLYDRTVAQYNRLEKKYLKVLGLAKKSADTNEYCLKGLEDKVDGLTRQNAILKERLAKVKDVGFWDKDGKYIEDLQEIKEDEI